MAGCIATFGKIILVCLNLVFLLVSLALTAVGVILKFFTADILDKVLGTLQGLISDHLQTKFKIPDLKEVTELPFVNEVGLVLMVFGIVLFLISFCACCGACCELRPLLVVFVVAMVVLVIAQGVVGGLFLAKNSVLHDKIRDKVGTQIKEEYDKDGNNMISFAINLLNYMLECCGFDGKDDFPVGMISPTCCKREIIQNDDVVKGPKCLSGTPDDLDLNPQGCYEKLQEKVLNNRTIAIVCLTLLLLLQVVEVIFALAIVKDVGKVGAM